MRARGVTLIELVVAVAIVGILATIALPSYQQYRLRANRADGKQCLLDANRRMEAFFNRQNRYTSTLTQIGYASNTPTCAGGLYSLAVSNPSGCPISRCYTLTATALGKQVNDGDLRLTFDASKINPNERIVKQRYKGGSWQAWD